MMNAKDVKVNLDFGDGSILLYQFIHGSHAHGCATETSDIDTMSVYVNPLNKIIGFQTNNTLYTSDEKNDNVGYELARYLELLTKSNPTMLESLFIPEDCIIYKHPIMDDILQYRDKFLSKDALKSFSEYALAQIRKARGYNKLCAFPEDMVRKQPIDFCYTFNGYQGTEPITTWLEKHGLKQIYCGLNHMPNMNQMYGVFYDWGQHIHMEWKTAEEFAYFMMTDEGDKFLDEVVDKFNRDLYYQLQPLRSWGGKNGNMEFNIKKWIKLYNEEIIPSGYHGIQKESGTSCDIHLDSIKKKDVPICYLSYNENGFQSHCTLYKQWSDWKKNRNKIRYESNYGKNYDSKNLSECIRLLTMGCELAEGKGFNVDRRIIGDSKFLLDIKGHKYTYEELMDIANQLEERLKKAIPSCDLPEKVNTNEVNDLLLDIRKKLYKLK